MTGKLQSDEARARDEICRVGRSLFERGHVHASAGNISVKLADGSFLITPTDACLGFLQPQRLAKVDAHGVQIDGDKASKTLALHRRVYATCSDLLAEAACVLHTHSHHCVALSLARLGQAELLPQAWTAYFLMKVGRVPMLRYERPGADQVAEQLVQVMHGWAKTGVVPRCVMLERLGPLVWHASPAAAMAALEELEATARLVWEFARAGLEPPPGLSPEQILELRRRHDVRW